MLSPDAIAAVCIFLATQTGALIFFAGVVSWTLRNHDKRLDKNEARCEGCLRVVTQLATKEGIEL